MAYSYTKEQSINIIRKVLESISSGNVNKMQYASEELYDLIICNLNPNLEIQETNNREEFEQAVYKRYFISHIGSNLSLDYNTKTLADLCAKDSNGEYIDKDISAMWFGYNIKGL